MSPAPRLSLAACGIRWAVELMLSLVRAEMWAAQETVLTLLWLGFLCASGAG